VGSRVLDARRGKRPGPRTVGYQPAASLTARLLRSACDCVGVKGGIRCEGRVPWASAAATRTWTRPLALAKTDLEMHTKLTYTTHHHPHNTGHGISKWRIRCDCRGTGFCRCCQGTTRRRGSKNLLPPSPPDPPRPRRPSPSQHPRYDCVGLGGCSLILLDQGSGVLSGLLVVYVA